MNLTGIQFRLLLLGILPSLLLVTSLASYFIQYHYLDLENALKEKGQITINQLAISSIYGVFSGNTEILNDISNALLEQPDIVSVHILDNLNTTLARSERLTLPSEKDLIFFKHAVFIQPISKNNNSINTPYIKSNKIAEKKIGTVEIALSLENTYKKQQAYLVNSLLLIGFGISCTILLAIRLSKSISSPIISLTKNANELADGHMNARAATSSIAEIDDLCQSFNTMAIGLHQTHIYLIHQIELAVDELTTTLANLEEKNKSLEKSTQLAIRQNKTKSQFIAHISHEIRTPMNGVLGFIDLLTKSQLTIQQLEQTQLIKTSTTSLLTIVNEILDYSSLETGGFKINISTFNFRENLENCATTLFPASNQVQIIIDIDNNVPQFISTDPIRLQQITTNLLGNACRFTHKGHIIIRCRLINKHSLFISISDTGTGIHKDKIKDLFQPFLQSSEYAVDNELGTGLGLSICKNIITRLGGRLGVCTKYHTGSTFWFFLPISFSETEELEVQAETILLIDHSNLRRKALVKQFASLGYHIQSYSSVTKLSLQPETTYDLIFYAYKNETFEAMKILNKMRSVTNQAPIIFLKPKKNYFQASNFLPLPCRSSYLKNLIGTIMKKNQPISEPIEVKTSIRSNSFSIFIADDNEINRILLKSQLEAYCKNITLAKDGKAALSYLQNNKYDLILLDLQMPHYSGLELIKLTKQKNSINKDSPIIAITAHAQSHQRKMLINAGFDECLIKPVLLEHLFEILDLWLPGNHDEFTYPTGQPNLAMIMLDKTSGDKDLAISLFNKLFSELKEQSDAIEHALDNKNHTLAEEITHKLHGSVSFCGFIEMQKAAETLEKNLMKKKLWLLNSNFLHLKSKIIEFNNLQKQILTFLHEDIH